MGSLMPGRKLKPNRDKGEPTRLSNEVRIALKKRARNKESFDSILRRMLGLPDRNGRPQILQVFWLLPSRLIAKRTQAEAKGEAVLLAAREGKKKIMESPIKVIESI